MHLDFFLPSLSDSTQTFLRAGYGAVQLGNLLLYLPSARRFFVSERWRGYGQSQWAVDVIQNPWVMPGMMVLWIACALGILLDRWTLPALGINWMLCWYYFVWARWRGVLRGSGAPGLMNYWLAAAVFFIELARRMVPVLQPLTVLVFQIELAFILFTSGFYKLKAGFLQNEGMDYGLVNPEWGYWCKMYHRFSPRHWIFKVYNQCAWSGQILSAILMVIPGLRWLGGALLIVSFLIVQANIRLALLSVMMMLCGLLSFETGTPADKILSGTCQLLGIFSSGSVSAAPYDTGFLHPILLTGLLMYLCLLPVVYGGLFYNFYARKSLPLFLQRALEHYANFFGMILWRVFTVDLIDFYIQIYRAPWEDLDRRALLSHWDRASCLRFRHVAESITVTTLFTTLKYYPSRPELFQQRLLRYSRSLPCSENEVLIFAYVRILKKENRYMEETAQEFFVDPNRREVKTLWKLPGFSIGRLPDVSPIHEASSPGSYKPA